MIDQMSTRAQTVAPIGAVAEVLAASTRLRALLAELRRRWAASRQAAAQRRTARELLEFDQHILDDIGVTRAHLYGLLEPDSRQ